MLEHLVGILGKTFPKPMITALQAPVFHSHAFSIFVQLLATPAAEEVTAQLDRSGGGVTVHTDTDGPSPVGVVGTDTIHLGRVRHGGNFPGSYSLWVVADNLRIAAANAIRTAEHIMLAPALDT